MIKKLIGALTVGLLLAANANAATLSITGPDSVMVGDSFELQIWASDFTDGLRAGGINFLYDSALVSLDGVTLEIPTSASFSCPGSANCPADTAGSTAIVWGEFQTDLLDPGHAGPTLMATVSLTAIAGAAEALAVFDMTSNIQLTGGWFGSGFAAIDAPVYEGAVVDVQTAVIPLPAAVWFMMGGLGVLARFRRK